MLVTSPVLEKMARKITVPWIRCFPAGMVYGGSGLLMSRALVSSSFPLYIRSPVSSTKGMPGPSTTSVACSGLLSVMDEKNSCTATLFATEPLAGKAKEAPLGSEKLRRASLIARRVFLAAKTVDTNLALSRKIKRHFGILLGNEILQRLA